MGNTQASELLMPGYGRITFSNLERDLQMVKEAKEHYIVALLVPKKGEAEGGVIQIEPPNCAWIFFSSEFIESFNPSNKHVLKRFYRFKRMKLKK